MQRTLALAAAAVLAACGSSSGGSRELPNGDEPNDTLAEAKPLAPGTPIVATVGSAEDYDFFHFPVPAGGATLRFQTFDEGGVSCDPVNDTVDTFVEVYDASGSRLAWSDDSGVNLCEDFTLALPGGTGYVAVSGYLFPSVYTLLVTIP